MRESVIYLDNNATTSLDKEVLRQMMPYLTDNFGNASSLHRLGKESNIAVAKAREAIGDLINSNPEDIIFTAGATEAINLALRGVISALGKSNPHIITVSVEHPAVLDTCRFLEGQGIEVSYLSVQSDGLIDEEEYRAAFLENTVMACIMWANNETGVLQSIASLAEIAHTKGALFMTDATQAVGKIPVDVLENGIDLMAFSAHKFYGPKGIGALYINPLLNIAPIIFGGGQERGLRSGTLNVPGIVGMGAAAKLAEDDMSINEKEISSLSQRLQLGLLSLPNVRLNGHYKKRLYNTISICFDGVDSDALMLNLGELCVSNGSACHSMTMEASHVLRAMGMSKADANSSLRFSLGRHNTSSEIDYVISRVAEVLDDLRALENVPISNEMKNGLFDPNEII